MNENANPESSEPTAPLMAAPAGGETPEAPGGGEASTSTASERRGSGAARSVLTSRGTGWGVAAGLAGVIVGYAIGHATAPSSTTVVPVANAVSPGQIQRVAVPGGVAVKGPAGIVVLPGMAPFATPACRLMHGSGPITFSPGVFGPGVLGPGVFGPGAQIKVIGPARWRVIIGRLPLRKTEVRIYSKPGGPLASWVAIGQPGPAAVPWSFAGPCQVMAGGIGPVG